MGGKSQFSLAYLLGEVSLFAVAIGLTRIALTQDYSSSLIGAAFYTYGVPLLALGALICWGAAIGGIGGRMLEGARFVLLATLTLVFLAMMFSAMR